jgi:molybdopterin/thiamine biosynthesis adenylyltransferase
MNYVIGAGGIASWLVPVLCKLVGCTEVTVIDKDTVEFRNLDRQFFDVPDIGKPKAMALAEKYSCNYIGEWYTCGCLDHDEYDVLLVCADNHPARLNAILAADLYEIDCIIAANERTSSEAYYYQSDWRGTNLDPRVYYPEILDDHTGDPRLAAIGCTGAAQDATPQLVSANLMAAGLALHLFMVWGDHGRFEVETIPHLPMHLRMNMSKCETFKATIKERIEHETTSTNG